MGRIDGVNGMDGAGWSMQCEHMSTNTSARAHKLAHEQAHKHKRCGLAKSVGVMLLNLKWAG